MRPQSPLSSRYEGSSARFDSFRPPSPRKVHGRSAGNNHRRANSHSLKLPSLPRFHPANFPSSQYNNPSSYSHHPSGRASPQRPGSPRAIHQRMSSSDAQKHLLAYHRDLAATANIQKPQSPRLAPLGSPGPVTPLELEHDHDEGYLVAGARRTGKVDHPVDELLESLIQEEARRGRAGGGSHANR